MIARTTICCSAIVLAATYGMARAVQPDADAQPFFPADAAWSLPVAGILNAAPAFGAIRGYLPLDNDRLEAFDLAKATRIWTVPLAATTRPAVGDNLVFVARPDAVVALREGDGSIAWQHSLAERLAVPIVWDYSWLITVSESGAVVARRAVDGKILWEQHLDSPASAPPALASDRVYVPTVDQRVVALQVETGHRIWARALGGFPQTIVARDDRVYVGADNNYLYCLRTSDGQVDWRWRTGGDIVGVPHVDDGRVYFASLDNILRGLDRRSGGQRWLRPLPLRPNAGPIRAADTLIVSGPSPALHAYALRDGKPSGQMEADGDLAAPPQVVDVNGRATLVVFTRDVARGTVMTGLRSRAQSP